MVKTKRLIRLADVVTLLNLVSGMTAILLAVIGFYVYAIWMIVLALIFDVMDGIVARKTKSESEFGKELDSLCDLVSFGVAPAVIAALMYPGKFSVIVAIVFVASGAVRLAKFNVLNIKKYFIGTPIPTSVPLLLSLYLISAPAIAYPVAILVLAVTMNLPIKIKKISIQ